MASFLSTTDLHLTAAPREAYRWGVFPWMVELLNKIPHTITDLLLLGDITDCKDFHSSLLVNKVVDALADLHKRGGVQTIWVLRGNHDGIDPECPYFRFLSHTPFIRFIHKPTEIEIGNRECLMLPHTRNPEEDWKDINFRHYNFIFMHNTVTGAVAETGRALTGLNQTWFHGVQGKIFSGDVHVPQKIGAVEYIGAPYHVRFGDSFTPRALLYLDGLRQPDPRPQNLSRLAVTVKRAEELRHIQYHKGDQIKVRLSLSRSEYVDWQKHKREVQSVCRELELDLCVVELERIKQPLIRATQAQETPSSAPQEALERFCAQERVDGLLREVGELLL